MEPTRPNLGAGQRLKTARERLGLSTRDVQRKSEHIAIEKRNQEYYLSHAWLTDIEQGKFMPGLFKLYSISAIYDKSFSEIASYFGLRIADLRRDRASIGVPRTHLVDREGDAESQSVSLPVEFKPEFRFEKTNLLSRVVEKWDEVPIGLLQHLDLRKSMYGYIGLEDNTLYPLIRPGSLVQIDPGQRKISSAQWRTEFERPIYFIELRDGYLCSWCQLEKGQLMVIPHPQSRQAIRHFDHPAQAEVVGRVTGVAMRIVEEADMEGGPTPL
ncbi:MAG TPA: helix-turn-helix transcriptional regulator [Candidatus Acidoferrales bacterium]|jgi:transcriptional regulator with XRE-family HTH domain|nr:helix-turn-helix transcriptional regulator [Candidatus Acidoferrales bacterium]